MFRLLTKPECQKLSKFSGYRQTDKPAPRSCDPELKNALAVFSTTSKNKERFSSMKLLVYRQKGKIKKNSLQLI